MTDEVPDITDHTPVPINGKLPFKVDVEAHIVKSDPAFETVGYESTKIEIVLVDAGQTPFVIDHSKILFPVANSVTPDVFSVGVVTEDPPASTDQVPIPTNGEFALSVEFVVHNIWFKPA